MTSTPKVVYPYGTTYQPDEHVLQLTAAHVLELDAALTALGPTPPAAAGRARRLRDRSAVALRGRAGPPKLAAMSLRSAALAVLISAAWTATAHADGPPDPDRARAEQQAKDGARSTMPPELAKYYEQEPTIELVTMGIGALIWERHGHIALCVRYHDPRKDACYNYGIGDFHQPLSMAWGFFRGTRSFWVGKMRPDRDALDLPARGPHDLGPAAAADRRRRSRR